MAPKRSRLYIVALQIKNGITTQIMKKKSTIYVRTDKRKFTFDTTIPKNHYPEYKMRIINKPLKEDSKTQTKLYGDKTMKPGEVDIILI